MGDGNHQRDVAHALTSDFLLRHLNAAVVANDVLVTDALVFSAVALPVLHGTEDALAEQTIAFWFVGAIVYGLRLENLAV